MSSRKLFCAALSALLMWMAGPAAGGEQAIPLSADPAGNPAAGASLEWFEEKGLTLGESSVAYPSLREGILPEELREAVNEQILKDGAIREYATRISQLISGGKLEVSWQGTVLGPVFSFAVSAEGAVKTPRFTHVWTGGSIDLRDGHEIPPEELFTDPEAAREHMETYLEEEVVPDFSAHLLNSQAVPLPEICRISERGMILMYPMDQLSTLSDRAGDILIPWQVLRGYLILDLKKVMAE